KKRVEPFARLLGLPFISFAAKPLPMGLKKAMKAMGGTEKNTAAVGDQVFTDVMGGHLLGVVSIMVMAIKEEDYLRFKIKRKFEKKFIDEYIDKNGGVL
ncbi:MAG: HAD hydrolase-like protein, partial [Oscillospiraceae bacterium]